MADPRNIQHYVDELLQYNRQGPQEYGVQRAEDDRIGADPHRQQRGGYQRKSGTVGQSANCVAKASHLH